MPLYERDGALHAVFTRRQTTCAATPARSPSPAGGATRRTRLLTTALREAEEEIGLPREAVQSSARSPHADRRDGFGVYPFVGLIEPGREWTLSPREVDEVLELRLATSAPQQPPAPVAPRDPVSQRRLRRQRGGGHGARRRGSSAICWSASTRCSTGRGRSTDRAMSRDDLLRSLRSHIADERVLAAVAEVPRELFVRRRWSSSPTPTARCRSAVARPSPSRRSSRACASCSS